MSTPPLIRAAIVDDEPPARERIRWLLRDQPDVVLVGEFEDARSAADALRREGADLLFLDVRLPETDGVELLEALGSAAPPQVIFVTAYDHYAVRAFELHATDYLLKPYDPARFYAALDRARQALRAAAEGHAPTAGDAAPADLGDDRRRDAAATPPRFLDRIAVRTGGRIVLVRVEDVEWIEARGNYARLHVAPAAGAATPGPAHLVRETMAALEAALDPARFVRIHRSAIVNLERVRELHPLFHGEYVVILRSGTRLTLSRGYRHRLRGRWGSAL